MPTPEDRCAGCIAPADAVCDIADFCLFMGRRPGPKTSKGKAIAARNATSHGLFARDIVLPHLGEDPTAYDALFLEIAAQINPRNLIGSTALSVKNGCPCLSMKASALRRLALLFC